MAKVCAVCGKSNTAGRRIQHHHSVGWRFKAPRSTRVFKLNMRKIDLELSGTVVRTDVCMKCYKKLRKEGKE
ncbi:50S ribosomal protein L28 [bacterium]|nr:50S ribosomal protein L28 [bacterium]